MSECLDVSMNHIQEQGHSWSASFSEENTGKNMNIEYSNTLIPSPYMQWKKSLLENNPKAEQGIEPGISWTADNEPNGWAVSYTCKNKITLWFPSNSLTLLRLLTVIIDDLFTRYRESLVLVVSIAADDAQHRVKPPFFINSYVCIKCIFKLKVLFQLNRSKCVI